LALGEQIVRELELTDGVDTLGKWMAHHLASLIQEAKRSGGAQTEVTQEAVALIFKLWKNRNSLPGTVDPMSSLKRAIDVIERISQSSSPFYRQSRDKRESDLALLFDGLRQLVAHGVILVSDQKKIPDYTAETFEHLSEEEQQVIVGLGGWVAFFEETKPKISFIRFPYGNDDVEKKQTEEAAELEQLEPDERSRVLFARSVDELIENLQSFKTSILGDGGSGD